MKMPLIKVTPSSPSPDPNHPDYPEFFEDRVFLEQQRRRRGSSRTSSSSRGDLENFSLILEASDIEGEGGEGVNTVVEETRIVDDDKVIMAPSPEQQADPVGDNDTPVLLEDLVKEARQSNLDDPGSVPPSVFKILEQAKGRQLGGKIHFMQ